MRTPIVLYLKRKQCRRPPFWHQKRQQLLCLALAARLPATSGVRLLPPALPVWIGSETQIGIETAKITTSHPNSNHGPLCKLPLPAASVLFVRYGQARIRATLFSCRGSGEAQCWAKWGDGTMRRALTAMPPCFFFARRLLPCLTRPPLQPFHQQLQRQVLPSLQILLLQVWPAQRAVGQRPSWRLAVALHSGGRERRQEGLG